MARVFIIIGALFGFSGVVMAAISAHALPARLTPKALAAVQSGVQMQGWHALALVLTGIWMLRAGPASMFWAQLAGIGFAVGTLLFSGSIYAGELAGFRIGPTAPTGGILLMLGWVLLAISGLREGPTP